MILPLPFILSSAQLPQYTVPLDVVCVPSPCLTSVLPSFCRYWPSVNYKNRNRNVNFIALKHITSDSTICTYVSVWQTVVIFSIISQLINYYNPLNCLVALSCICSIYFSLEPTNYTGTSCIFKVITPLQIFHQFIFHVL